MTRVASWVLVGVVALGCSAHEPEAELGAKASSALHHRTAPRAQATLGSPPVGPEIGTDVPVPVPSNYGESPVVASDGHSYLVAFEDYPQIGAVRTDANGQVLDLPWLAFGEGDQSQSQTQPAVAFGGGHYLVVWMQSNGVDSLTVHGRLVSPDGKLIGAQSFQISSGQGLSPAVAWNGQRFVVAWQSLGVERADGVKMALVDPNGSVVASSEKSLTMTENAQAPKVAAGSSVSLVAWAEPVTEDTNVMRGARIGSDGTVLDAGGVLLSQGSDSDDEVEVAAGTDGFLIVGRRESRPDAQTSTIIGSLMGEDGSVTTRDVVISHASGQAGIPSAVFNGQNYLVAWAEDEGNDQHGAFGNLVSETGVVASTIDKQLATGSPWAILSSTTSLAWANAQFFLTFQDQNNGITGSLLDANLNVKNGALELSPLPNRQGSPQLAFTGGNYLVGWVDERGDTPDLYSARAVRVSPNGQVLDPAGIAWSDNNTAFSLSDASNGKGSGLGVWGNLQSENWLRSIGDDGTLGTATKLIGSDSPSIASNGESYLVVTSVSQSTTMTVHGRVLDAKGSGGADFTIVDGVQIDSAMALSAGHDYLVRVRNDGIQLLPVSTAGVVGTALQLTSGLAQVNSASHDAQALVVWTDFDDTQIHARRYSAGWQGDELAIADTSAGYAAAVAWDGSTYWLVWESDTETERLLARTVSADGQLGETIKLVDDECFAPALASDGDGQMLLSYYKYGDNSRTRRIVSRLVGRVPDDMGMAGASGVGAEAGAGDGTSGGSGGGTAQSGGSSSRGGASTAGGASAAGGATSAAGSANKGGSTARGGASNTAGTSASAGAAGDGAPGSSGCNIGDGSSSASGVANFGAWALALAALRRGQARRKRSENACSRRT